jgi:branched-chain amino acid aminotransferase
MSEKDQWWVNGALVDPETATLPVMDHGLTVGDGCFETAKIVRGEAFALTRHLRRLRRSLAAMLLDLPLTDDELRAAVAAVLATSVDAGVVRITVTAGPGPLGSGRGDGPPTVMIAPAPSRGWGGATEVVTVPWTRNERGAMAGVKSTSYAENVIALVEAKKQGASEAIFANTVGNLCEGTGTNIFCELDGRLVTPPLSAGCLAGVTRELVLETSGVDEIDVPIGHLALTAEAFLTSSTRDVMAISRINGRAVETGPLTRAAATAFSDLEATTLDP